VEKSVAQKLQQMILEDVPLGLPGTVLQELLSGVRGEEQASKLEDELTGFPVVLATREDHLLAAKIYNSCRRKGISPANVDCLIAALAVARSSLLWALDRDFEAIARVTELRLFEF
jgi:predicted nucleic acid-binding protein